MPAYRTPEYVHLLEAERAIAAALLPKTEAEDGSKLPVPILPEPKDIASLASALVRVIDQKRIMRGQPAPKPIDTTGKRNTRSRSARVIDVTPAYTPLPDAAPSTDASKPTT